MKKLLKKLRSLNKFYRIIIYLILLFIIIAIITIAGFNLGCPIINTLETTNYENPYNSQPSNNGIERYDRPEESTYLTFPEWHLVYISEDYANVLGKDKPSKFRYLGSLKQYWQGYCNVHLITKDRYGFNFDNHLMLLVIGTSTTLEYGGKFIYENSIGRLTEATMIGSTKEDQFAYRYGYEYGKFLYDLPWYEYSYKTELKRLWTETDYIGINMIRKYERKIFLSTELILKAIYGAIIKVGTKAILGNADLHVYATIETSNENILENHPRIELIEELPNNQYIIKIPRYRQFTEIIPELSKEEMQFIDISNNQLIFLTIITPNKWEYNLDEGYKSFEMDVLSDKNKKRIGITAPVQSLNKILPELQSQNIFIEHLYDY
jgi:hypothetical protein